jgi:hypothetical protein
MRWLVLSIIVALLSVVAGPVRAEPANPAAKPDERTRFAGTFRYAGDAREEAARAKAIDRAIETLFFAIRGIARSRLSNGTKIDPSVTFAFDAGKIRSRIPSSPEVVSPENGTPVSYVADGERSTVTQRLVGSKLTQTFIADEGQRSNEWTLSADGTTLLLKVTVSSPKLSTPLVYVLTYRK